MNQEYNEEITIIPEITQKGQILDQRHHKIFTKSLNRKRYAMGNKGGGLGLERREMKT